MEWNKMLWDDKALLHCDITLWVKLVLIPTQDWQATTKPQCQRTQSDEIYIYQQLKILIQHNDCQQIGLVSLMITKMEQVKMTVHPADDMSSELYNVPTV